MWDEIFAEVAGDVTGSIVRKDERGVTRTVAPAVAPAGDLLSEDAWLTACKGGGKIAEKGKTEGGATVARAVKELSGKQCVRAATLLLGVARPATKRTGKPEQIIVATQQVPEPSANGTHS